MTQIEPAQTIEEAIVQTLAFCGVSKLTKDNVKKVHLRSKQIQYLQFASVKNIFLPRVFCLVFLL